jgi:hypothetical protein
LRLTSKYKRSKQAAVEILKISGSKFTRGLDPLKGDACSAKGFEVLPLIFTTDCSLIDWLQSVLKIKSFEIYFFFSQLFEDQASRLGGGKLD